MLEVVKFDVSPTEVRTHSYSYNEKIKEKRKCKESDTILKFQLN